MIRPGEIAPDFELPSAFNNQVGRVRLSRVDAEVIVLFFYPHDFSFVCPTEVLGFHQELDAFGSQRCKLLGVSVDDVETHLRWARELGGVGYPLLADVGGAVARDYGCFDEQEGVALRATFILDANRSVLYTVASPVNVGRSVSETLRVVCALRTGRLCPADWNPGDAPGPAGSKF